MSLGTSPIVIDSKPANNTSGVFTNSINTFNSYSFDRNILTPASAFRFTAPGIEKTVRMAIRSGDMVALYAVDDNNKKWPLATGIVDETDTHIVPNSLEYVLTGRDTLGQLVDNASVDIANKIINTENVTLQTFLQTLIANTRIPQGFVPSPGGLPNGKLLINTNIGETKINALQRYLDFMNCLIWSNAQGQAIIGKPNFAQDTSGHLVMDFSDSRKNNLLECRVRRNTNQAIRQISTRLQTQAQVDAGQFTTNNQDDDMKKVVAYKVGRSVSNIFSYGQGSDAANQIVAVGNQSGSPQVLGAAYSRREIARENVKVLDVEVVVEGHFNEAGTPYNIDQIYDVQIEDEDVNEEMYVYSCNYELTLEHASLTRMRLCRRGNTLVDGAAIVLK